MSRFVVFHEDNSRLVLVNADRIAFVVPVERSRVGVRSVIYFSGIDDDSLHLGTPFGVVCSALGANAPETSFPLIPSTKPDVD